MKNTIRPKLILYMRIMLLPGCVTFMFFSCAAPRSVNHSSDVTPKGEFRVGANMSGNIGTETVGSLYEGLAQGVRTLSDQVNNQDSVVISADSLNQFYRILLAHSLDPLAMPIDFNLRYGLGKGFDIGYRYYGGAHAIDARYQFLGLVQPDSDEWQGSLALQYSFQNYGFPFFLGTLQDLLQFEFSRKDFLIPLVFGKTLGKGGELGSIAFGPVYNLSLIEWDSNLLNFVEESSGETRNFDNKQGSKHISAFGIFSNLRFGYKYVYLLLSLSVYWQDYGTYQLFNDESISLSGWTLIPVAGVEFRF